MFHVVFALKSSAAFSVAKCYHELSKAIAIAIRYEERYVVRTTVCILKSCSSGPLLGSFSEINEPTF